MSRNLKIKGLHPEVIMRSNGIISMERPAEPVVLTAFEARGGGLGQPVLAVLIVSTLATIGLFATLSIGYF